MDFDIPGRGRLRIQHLVLDYNGTIALDGIPIPGVAERLERLAAQPDSLRPHILTADTLGDVRLRAAHLPCELVVIGPAHQAEAKAAYVRARVADGVAALGNGLNDRLMLAEATLGVAVIGEEGAAAGAIASADVVCTSILHALDLFLTPNRLIALLRG